MIFQIKENYIASHIEKKYCNYLQKKNSIRNSIFLPQE